jgi:hypothetical protein
MTVVCFTSSVPAHVHVLVEMHDVLYFLHASSESPKSVVEKRGSQWMSSTLGKLCALRCWLILKVCYEEAAMFLLPGLMTWTPFQLQGVGAVYKTQVRDACFSLLLSSAAH